MGDEKKHEKKVVVRKNGPYVVYGNVPLVHKKQIVSEQREPLTWETGETLNTRETYILCRCGKSHDKPFCDGTHDDIEFDGAETADTRPSSEREKTYPGSTRIVVKHDDYLCTNSGFCGNRMAKIANLIPCTDDISTRTQVISMVEHCPSGALTFSMKEGDPVIEPDYPRQVAATTEHTKYGDVEGPLWVTGNIPVERADGQQFETRNRVTLCGCGRSKHKPLCDGSHRIPENGTNEGK